MRPNLVRLRVKWKVACPMSNDDILRAHTQEIWELRVQELMERFDITKAEATNFIFVSILLDHAEGKTNE